MRLSKTQCRCILALAGAMGAATACRDSSAPAPDPLVVEVRLAGPPLHRIDETSDGPTITCPVDFLAKATGDGTATWEGATFYWYFGSERLTPVDSASISAAEIRDSWGQHAIVAAVSQQAGWEFTAGAPFEVRADFQYLRAGSSTPVTATARFACGPIPSVGPPPSITQVSVQSGAGELQPGDVFSVVFSAGASQGLWVSGVVVEGPFEAQQIFSERVAPSTTRTAIFTVPAGVALGAPLSIAVFAVDVSLKQVVRIVPTQVRIVDRTPPSINVAWFPEEPGGGFAGQFAVGDTLQVRINASDNNAPAWLVYSLGAPANVRDSVPVELLQPNYVGTLKIPIRPEWVGAPVLSVQVRDHAGLTSEVRSTTPDSLRFYPVVTHPVTTTVGLPFSPANQGDVAYDAQRQVLYVGQAYRNEISVIAMETMTLGTPIRLPAEVAGIDLTPSGDSLIVALPFVRSLAVVNLREPSAPVGIIPMTALDTVGAATGDEVPRPYGVRVASNGVAIITLSFPTRARDQVASVDLRTGNQRIRGDANGTNSIALGSIERTPDHSRIVILARVCSRTYLAASDAFTPCGRDVSVSAGVFATFNAAADRLTYGALILDAQFNVIRTVRSSALAITLDGAFVYEGTNGFVRKTRVADGVVMERFPVGLPAEQLFLTPDGNTLVVLSRFFGGRVARVDLRQRTSTSD